MRTKRTLALSLFAAVVVGGLGGATTALAALPEFLRSRECKEMRAISGFPENVWRWTNIACSTESATITGNFAESPFVSNKAGGTANATFESRGGRRLICSAETGQGEVSGVKKVSKTYFAYSNCEEPATTVRCNSPRRAAGVIVTSFLTGEIGYVPATRQVGVDLWPDSRTATEIRNHEFRATLAEFECVGVGRFVVRGGLIGEITPTNSLVRGLTGHFTLKYEQRGGSQTLKRLTGVEGETENQLEISLNGGAFENLGLAITAELIPAEAQEIKA